MKLLFPLNHFYPSSLGGPAVTIYWLAKELVRNDIDVTIITSNDNISDTKLKPDTWLELDGISVRYCQKQWYYFRSIWHSCIALNKCDVIILSSIFERQNLLIGLYAKLIKRKIIWSPRGELFNTALLNSRIKISYLKVLKSIFSNSVLFHATSEVEKKAIEDVFGDKASSFVLPNYMIIPQKTNSDSKEKCMIYMGRIAPIKALDKLIKGFSLSHEFIGSDFLLKIVGGVEPQFEYYYIDLINFIKKNNLADKVVFTGPVVGEVKESLYASAYASFLVSESENFGNVVIESLAQGTPVVASKGTPWESLNNESAGFWIDNDPFVIANTIDDLIRMPYNQYHQMRINALNLAQQFDVSKNVYKWVNILKEYIE